MANVTPSVNMTVNSMAGVNWSRRGDDSKFLTMEALRDSVDSRKTECWTATPQLRDLRVTAENNQVSINVFDPTIGERQALLPTNWGFGQLAQFAKAPAAYLRTLPAELAAINLQWGLERNPLKEEALILAQSNGHHALRSITSTSYGRIWDRELVKVVDGIHQTGNWHVPAGSHASRNAKAASTLYASDRDVFIFLVDDTHPIEFKGEQLFRGFMAWNSEVGAATFGFSTFLYQRYCENRTIYGVSNIHELRIRHTGGAPERFAHEGARYLERYANESTQNVLATLNRADAAEIENASKGVDTVSAWLQARGFTKAESRASYDTAKAERGDVRSVWDIVNGITAHARSIPFTDERTNLESRAGKLLESVAA